jgi:hypothetical protein
MSSKYEVIPFEIRHGQALEGQISRLLGYRADRFLQLYSDEGLAFSWVVNEAIMGCGGLVRQWPGLCCAWLMLQEAPQGAAAWNLARTCKRLLPALARELQARRVQTLVMQGFPRHVRFVEWLGFDLECVKPKYGADGETFAEYVWFPGGPSWRPSSR